MLEKFIYAKEKSLFETALNNGEVLDEAIVFIEDTKEIWNHGTYFDGSTFDSSNIELSILNISNTIADYATIRSAASTAVLPEVIADMETKTEAAATYQPIGDYITKTEVANSYLVKGNYIEDDVRSDGVYAVDANGKLIDYNLADTTATGVALIAKEHKFMIAKSDATDGTNTTLYWDKSYSDLSLTNYGNADGTNSFGYLPKPDGSYQSTPNLSGDFTTWTAGALSDFNGKANTAVIAAASSHAKDMCTELNTFNASDSFKDWYVPACGQLALMYLNMTEINAALAKIGGTALAAVYYWSSSESSSNRAWYVDFINGGVIYISKDNGYRVRFVRDISVSKPLKERVSELESSVSDLKLNCYSKEEIDALLGDINAALEEIINGPTFTIIKEVRNKLDGTPTYYKYTFNFKKGMTWGEWVNSGYNTSSYETIGNIIIIGGIGAGKVSFGGITNVQDEEVVVDLNDLIIKNHQYYISIPITGGSN